MSSLWVISGILLDRIEKAIIMQCNNGPNTAVAPLKSYDFNSSSFSIPQEDDPAKLWSKQRLQAWLQHQERHNFQKTQGGLS